MPPRPDVTDERKHQILNAAEQVFSQKGLDLARMDDIADETGLSKGTLYLYFKSKEDLIIAILDRIFQREFRHLDTLDFTQGDAADRLRDFMEISIQDISRIKRVIPVAYEYLALAFRNKIVQAAIKQYFNRYMHILVRVIERGMETGEFRRVSAHDVAVAVGAIFEGTMLLWVYDKSMVDPEHHIRSGINLLLEGILAHA